MIHRFDGYAATQPIPLGCNEPILRNDCVGVDVASTQGHIQREYAANIRILTRQDGQ
jgi:hypothetical protein